MKLKVLLAGLVGVAMLSSCKSERQVLAYFQDIDTIQVARLAPDEYLNKIEPDDELFINVNTEDPSVSAMFNMPATNAATAAMGIHANQQLQFATYIVDSKGDIDYPGLGTLHVKGMTLEALKDLIENKVSEYVRNPIVTVRMVNFRFDVGGEVGRPGQISVNRDRFTILDALSAAGDITPYGQRENVLLIREENGERVVHRLDLTSADVLNSPYFYIKQNDYIYVEPNKIREDNARYNTNNAYKLSVISTIVSAASIIASLVIALTVK